MFSTLELKARGYDQDDIVPDLGPLAHKLLTNRLLTVPDSPTLTATPPFKGDQLGLSLRSKT